MTAKIKLYYDLLGIIEDQKEMINKQSELIAELVNENAEKENMIGVLTQEFGIELENQRP